MKASLSQVFACVLALASTSLLGCGSEGGGTSTGPGSGGSQGGAVTASGGVNAGETGAASTDTSTGGSTSEGGTPATGGQTVSQGGSVGQGGLAAGGSDTGGSAAGGKVSTGGVSTGSAASGGNLTTGASTGAPDAAVTGGRTTADAAASGDTATGGTTAPPIGGSSGKITVWMAGDSTMQPCGANGACPCGWGSQFSQVFNSDVTVVNSAVGGRSIQTWLYDPNVTTQTGPDGECVVSPKTYSPRWTAMLDPATGMKPGDYLFIQFGINDGSACNRHVGKALFQTYLGVMAKAASERGAQAIFVTSTSYMPNCSAGGTVQGNRGYGPETKAAGTANNVPVIDLTALSAALYSTLCPSTGDFSSTTSKVGLFFCNDHTHFEAAGALQIAKVVGKALKDQGIPLGAYVVN